MGPIHRKTIEGIRRRKMITIELITFLSLGIAVQALISYAAANYHQTEGYHPFWGFNAPYGFLIGVCARGLHYFIYSGRIVYWDALGLSFLVMIILSFFMTFNWTKNIEKREKKERENTSIGFKGKHRK